ncbi:MAG: methyltransferase [Sphingobium sp. 66-54]|nr:MAG: methyltransferase [Sphingobium sp. 66-54]
MASDLSNGWDAIADRLIAVRSTVGAEVVRDWARLLPAGGAVVDIGCGAGVPVSATLIDAGLQISGIDASPTLVAAFRQRFPMARVACEAAEESGFFGRKFDGAVAIGLLFLLPAEGQRAVIGRVASALSSGGRFLFSAPRQRCAWTDLLTGRPSRSLGFDRYERILGTAGMRVVATHVDEGENHYIDAERVAG